MTPAAMVAMEADMKAAEERVQAPDPEPAPYAHTPLFLLLLPMPHAPMPPCFILPFGRLIGFVDSACMVEVRWEQIGKIVIPQQAKRRIVRSTDS